MDRLEPHDIAWIGMRPKASGRMLPAGEAACAMRREDRTAIYLYERQDALDEAAQEAIRAAGGQPFLEAQPMTYRRAATAWIMTAKRPETRGTAA